MSEQSNPFHIPTCERNSLRVRLCLPDRAHVQSLVVCRDSCWARVRIALKALYAAKREHESSRGNDEIGASTIGPRLQRWRGL